MRNSNEKYGEMTGTKSKMYSVAGAFLELSIGKQKMPLVSETSPLILATDDDSGSAEIKRPFNSPLITVTKKVNLNWRPLRSLNTCDTNRGAEVSILRFLGCSYMANMLFIR